MEVLGDIMVVIILLCISASKQHIVRLQLTQCYINYISIKLEENESEKSFRSYFTISNDCQEELQLSAVW